MQLEISYEAGWEEDKSKIKIDGMELPEYRETIRNTSKFYRDQFLLITRIFDNKVKAFIKLLTANDEVQHFLYRVD